MAVQRNLYLLNDDEETDALNDNIRRLIETLEEGNVLLAFQMIEGGGLHGSVKRTLQSLQSDIIHNAIHKGIITILHDVLHFSRLIGFYFAGHRNRGKITSLLEYIFKFDTLTLANAIPFLWHLRFFLDNIRWDFIVSKKGGLYLVNGHRFETIEKFAELLLSNIKHSMNITISLHPKSKSCNKCVDTLFNTISNMCVPENVKIVINNHASNKTHFVQTK